MTPETFARWLDEVKSAGRAKTDKDAGALIGLSQNSVSSMRREGVTGHAAHRTALACAAVLAGIGPYE